MKGLAGKGRKYRAMITKNLKSCVVRVVSQMKGKICTKLIIPAKEIFLMLKNVSIRSLVNRFIDLKSDPDSIRGLCEYLLAFILVISVNTIWTFNRTLEKDYLKLASLILACVPIVIMLKQLNQEKRKKVYLTVIPFLILYFLLYVVYLVGNKEHFFYVIFGFGGPIVVYFIYGLLAGGTDTQLGFWNKFVNTVVAFAVVSLFFFLLGSVLGIVKPTWPVEYEWGRTRTCRSYLGLYYEPQKISFLFYDGFRNCGLFTEAPMFNYVLCLAILVEELLLKHNRRKEIILSVAIVTTFSTTGIILLAILFFYKLRKHYGQALIKKFSCKYKNKKAIKYGIGVFAVFAINFIIMFLVIMKKLQNGTSFSTRSQHLHACIKIFLKSFPFGCGFGNNEDIYAEMQAQPQGVSVGFLYLMAQGGVPFTLMYLIPLGKYIYITQREKNYRLVIFAALNFYLIFATNVISAHIAWFVVTYIFAQSLFNYKHGEWILIRLQKLLGLIKPSTSADIEN